MPLAAGCQHIALVTSDLDRLLTFYERVFDAETVWVLEEDGMRHALIDLGGGFCLHPFHFPGDHPEAVGKPGFFARGHLDHFSIAVPDRATLDRVRERLMAEDATDGTLADWGMLEQISFHDPDGMEAEVSVVKDGRPCRSPSIRSSRLPKADSDQRITST